MFGVDQKIADDFVFSAELRGERKEQLLVELQHVAFRRWRRRGGRHCALQRVGGGRGRHQHGFAAEQRSELGHELISPVQMRPAKATPNH